MDEHALSFEEAFDILEQTVRQLENGNLTVDESVKLYEQGMMMAKLCSAKLDSAELRINQLAQTEEGQFVVTELDIERSELL